MNKELLLQHLKELYFYDLDQASKSEDDKISELHRGAYITVKTIIDCIEDGKYDL